MQTPESDDAEVMMDGRHAAGTGMLASLCKNLFDPRAVIDGARLLMHAQLTLRALAARRSPGVAKTSQTC
ncbi:MAG: hypothetical protein EOP90_02435 [Lysobacteraceae bacterium]|nr:MAG: hypothetical protein EOP90_02435 [Xanthomonadaceae bacterium]